MNDRPDLYQQITDNIVTALETAGPWRRPWLALKGVGMPVNAVTGRLYRGINAPVLLAAAQTKGFTQAEWATFRQWRCLGADVRQGERATLVVFWKKLDAAAESIEAGDDAISAEEADTNRPRLVCRGYPVFNAAQVDGRGGAAGVDEFPVLAERIGAAEQFIANTNADIRFTGDRAFYLRSGDYIQVPAPTSFVGTETSTPTETFYATVLHELVHWSGTKAAARATSRRASAAKLTRWRN